MVFTRIKQMKTTGWIELTEKGLELYTITSEAASTRMLNRYFLALRGACTDN